jgi:hypothetical protein
MLHRQPRGLRSLMNSVLAMRAANAFGSNSDQYSFGLIKVRIRNLDCIVALRKRNEFEHWRLAAKKLTAKARRPPRISLGNAVVKLSGRAAYFGAEQGGCGPSECLYNI